MAPLQVQMPALANALEKGALGRHKNIGDSGGVPLIILNQIHILAYYW